MATLAQQRSVGVIAFAAVTVTTASTPIREVGSPEEDLDDPPASPQGC